MIYVMPPPGFDPPAIIVHIAGRATTAPQFRQPVRPPVARPSNTVELPEIVTPPAPPQLPAGASTSSSSATRPTGTPTR